MRRTVAAAGLRVRNGAILSPGVEERFLTAPPEQAPPPWDWRLLYIGRVVEQKGVVTAIEALSLLPKASTLRIVGEGDAAYVTELHRLADRLGVSDQVQFHPPVQRSELVSVYRAADVVLFPVTWAEPWGLVPLEAMASGRPVVATGRGGSADFLRSGENCLQFPAGDAAALAQSITTLAQNSDLRERIREGGHATASRHSEEAFNRRAVREIRQAAESGAAPRAGRR
jgi:glycosyltransferase involved in cell wall biosynthesis